MPSADTLEAAAAVSKMASGFASALRKNGGNAGIFDLLTYIRALESLGVRSRKDVYWAGRVSLVRSPLEIPIYDKTFESWWAAGEEAPGDDRTEDGAENAPFTEVEDADLEVASSLADEDSDFSFTAVRYSASETLSQKDFAKYSLEELDEAKKAITKMRLSIPQRTGRRLRTSKNRTNRLDMRRIARKALATEGEALKQFYLEPKTSGRRLVLILDISGSMEIYSRLLLRFAHSARASFQKVEVFTLSTRLTRITRELSSPDPDLALSRASGAVEDWSGGTRLGEGLQTFNNKWGMRGLARGAVVIISSDGWDLGEPELMAEQMERLQRAAHKVIWVNPLKASPDYEPLAQGMAAALPFIDNFVEGHSLFALEQLAELIAD